MAVLSWIQWHIDNFHYVFHSDKSLSPKVINKAFPAFLWYWTHVHFDKEQRTHNTDVRSVVLHVSACVCTEEVQKGRNSVRHCCLQFDYSIQPDLIAFKFAQSPKLHVGKCCFSPPSSGIGHTCTLRQRTANTEHRRPLVLHVSAPTSSLHWWGPKRPKQRAPSLSAVWLLHPTSFKFAQSFMSVNVVSPRLPLVMDTHVHFDKGQRTQNTDVRWYCMCLHQRLHCTEEVQKGRDSVHRRCLQQTWLNCLQICPKLHVCDCCFSRNGPLLVLQAFRWEDSSWLSVLFVEKLHDRGTDAVLQPIMEGKRAKLLHWREDIAAFLFTSILCLPKR